MKRRADQADTSKSAPAREAGTDTREAVRPKAFSYTRFSHPSQALGDSLRRQTERAAEYAAKHGLDLDTTLTFEDAGRSAFHGSNASVGKLGEFLEVVKAGKVPPRSYLLVENLDRISRDYARKALKILESIVDEGIIVVTLVDEQVYTAEKMDRDPMSLILSLMTFLRANQESVLKASRVRAAWANKRTKVAEGGTRLTSVVPSWLRVDGEKITVKPGCADVVRRIFKAYAAGQGFVAIAKALNSEGVPTFEPANGKRAKMWHVSYINRLLRNPATIGVLQPTTTFHEYLDENGMWKRRQSRGRKAEGDPIPGYYPAVIKEPLFRKVQAMLEEAQQPGRGKAAYAQLQNLFGGLAVCSKCGAAMRRKSQTSALANGDRKVFAYLACTAAMHGKACTYKAIPYDAAEHGFLSTAPKLFRRVPGGSKSASDSLEAKLRELEENISVAEDWRLKMRNLAVENRTPRTLADLQQAEAELTELEAERDALAAKLENIAGPLMETRLDDLRKALQAEPLDRRVVNANMRAVLSRVVFDLDTCVATLVWKNGAESEDFVIGFPPETKASPKKHATETRIGKR